MITKFGKELRKLRIEKDEVLKDMADKIGKTSAYISAIECNKREIPNWLIPKLKEVYYLSEEQVAVLEKAKDMSVNTLTMELTDSSLEQREVALKFARTFKDMDKDNIAALQSFFANLKITNGEIKE